MKNITSHEAREIFGLSRDDMKRLEKSGVLKPEKSGQGIASIYHRDDLNRLMDVKIYLLAGFRISDMPEIFTNDYDSDEGIEEQIHIYKKRIQMLEFLKTIRSDFNELGKLGTQRITNVSDQMMDSNKKVLANLTNFSIDNEQYDGYVWDIFKFIFTIDYLGQRNSYKENPDLTNNKILDICKILKKYIDLFHIEVDKKELQELLFDLSDTKSEEDKDIIPYLQEIVDDYKKSKEALLHDFEKTYFAPIIKSIDRDLKKPLKSFMLHTCNFLMDYFIDIDELFNLYKCIAQFARSMDKKTIEKGVAEIYDANLLE